jgi:flavin reductase (DIM6/NTAB) family NADH-FMN oxidoreductase RutF
MHYQQAAPMSNLLVFPRPAVHDQAFAEAISRLAGAAAIVTWRIDAPGGLLVHAVSLLSTRPARVLFGVAKDDPAHDGLLQAETCALNILSEADEEEAARFSQARSVQTRFPADRWRIEADQLPRLRAAAVHLSGAVDHRIDAGSHSLFVVRVEASEVNDRTPLISFDHGFRRLVTTGAAGAPATAIQAGGTSA